MRAWAMFFHAEHWFNLQDSSTGVVLRPMTVWQAIRLVGKAGRSPEELEEQSAEQARKKWEQLQQGARNARHSR